MDKVGSTSTFRPAASKTEDTTTSSSAEKKAGADQFTAAVSSAAKAADALASAAKEQSSSTSGAAKGQERSLELGSAAWKMDHPADGLFTGRFPQPRRDGSRPGP